MAWIESHQNIKEHKKTYLLMAALGCSKRDAVAIVHMIWWWCLDNALEGRIEVPSVALKAATEWEMDGDQLVDGLLTSGWLERHPEGGLLVHDWHHYCGSLVEKRLERKQLREKKAGDKRRPNNSRSGNKRRPTVSVSQSVSKPQPDQNQEKGIAAPAAITPQAFFVERFKAAYLQKTGKPYDTQTADFVISAELIRNHGPDALIEKAKILGVLCERRSVWFTKDSGWGSFTIKTLKQHWNGIVESAATTAKENQEDTERKKQEALRAEADRLVHRS